MNLGHSTNRQVQGSVPLTREEFGRVKALVCVIRERKSLDCRLVGDDVQSVEVFSLNPEQPQQTYRDAKGCIQKMRGVHTGRQDGASLKSSAIVEFKQLVTELSATRSDECCCFVATEDGVGCKAVKDQLGRSDSVRSWFYLNGGWTSYSDCWCHTALDSAWFC